MSRVTVKERPPARMGRLIYAQFMPPRNSELEGFAQDVANLFADWTTRVARSSWLSSVRLLNGC